MNPWIAKGRQWLVGAVTMLIFLVVWEAVVRLLHVRPITLPPPSAVVDELSSEWGWYLGHTAYTLLTTLGGFVLSVVVGVVLAMMLVGSRWFEHAVYPLIVALNSVPKVAVAPLFVIWLGTGVEPKIAIGFLIAVFAIVIDAVLGLKSVPPDILDLARALRGGRLATLWRIRFPCALPSLFAGMKVAISLALVGAIVGEFVSSQRGLGYVILSAQGTFDTVRVFAALFVLAVMGVLLFWVVGLAERLAIPWHASQKDYRPTA